MLSPAKTPEFPASLLNNIKARAGEKKSKTSTSNIFTSLQQPPA